MWRLWHKLFGWRYGWHTITGDNYYWTRVVEFQGELYMPRHCGGMLAKVYKPEKFIEVTK